MLINILTHLTCFCFGASTAFGIMAMIARRQHKRLRESLQHFEFWRDRFYEALDRLMAVRQTGDAQAYAAVNQEVDLYFRRAMQHADQPTPLR